MHRLSLSTLALVVSMSQVALGSALAADAAKTGDSERVPAARCVTEKATILRRVHGERDWHVVAQNEELSTQDLLLGLPGAILEASDGGVRLKFLTALEGQGPYPIKEAAVRLHEPRGADLDFTLDRGRVDLLNEKKAGAAKVRLHVRNAVWDLDLAEPGTRMAIEVYGRWPRGTHFTASPSAADVPTANMVFLAIHGRIDVTFQGIEHVLHAPPGPAILQWDSVTGQDATPKRLEKLPDWALAATADPALLAESKARFAKVREALETKPLDTVLENLLSSDQVAERRLAINAMGALDRLDLIGKAMREARTPDIWENGVLALRHWIGRGPGQDQALYKGLVENHRFTPVHAATVVQLLHSYGEEDLARPETYQTLIDFLDHDVLAIRGLAYWHLERLVPAGKEFGYNPLAAKPEREAAIAKWRKLVPPGEVPPRPHARSGH